jgi:hypothetical protein
MATEFLLNRKLLMECNRLAEAPALAGPTSVLLAMVSGNRKALEFSGGCVRVSRLSVGSQQSEPREDPGLAEIRARVFTEGSHVKLE